MKNELLVDFVVNKENKTIAISREFNGNIKQVWRAWTTAEMLDQWWGPKPWKAETKTLDFQEGGIWLYAMVSPEGEKHWSKTDFVSIKEKTYFSLKGGFSDEKGNINPSFPQNLWENTFTPVDSKVRVDILLTYDSVSDLEKELEMGFKEGMIIDFKQLDQLLAQ